MDRENERRPRCFAVLEEVFPMGKDGLRHSPERCAPCVYKVECLRAALRKSGGLEVEEEKVDRAYSAGLMGFFERWSKKKDIQRRKDEKKSREQGQGELS